MPFGAGSDYSHLFKPTEIEPCSMSRLKAANRSKAAPRALPRKGAKRAAKRDKGMSPYQKSKAFAK